MSEVKEWNCTIKWRARVLSLHGAGQHLWCTKCTPFQFRWYNRQLHFRQNSVFSKFWETQIFFSHGVALTMSYSLVSILQRWYNFQPDSPRSHSMNIIMIGCAWLFLLTSIRFLAKIWRMDQEGAWMGSSSFLSYLQSLFVPVRWWGRLSMKF